MRASLVSMIFIVISASAVSASETWRTERIDEAAMPAGGFQERGKPAPAGLPDGLVATAREGDVAAAWYGEPTRRYRHAILGDAIEAGALIVQTADGDVLTLALPASEVFEDRTPRLADLDGDGNLEIITIRASLTKGAAVTVYGLEAGALKQRATTDFIGRSNRWLNIAAIADFDGKPGLEIAHVRTPHIGGTLILHAYRDGALVPVASLNGFSNHAIGSREMRLSAFADFDGDGRTEIAVPSADRRSLRIVELEQGRLSEIGAVTLPGRIDKPVLMLGSANGVQLVTGTEDGSLFRIYR
ncbi:hypothetical protein [Hoeflea sp.]|uniref:hypothetical protein n=1 Tax=Hoeflea sp. TaxID=1940281 RepID=UPI003B010E06